MRSANRLRQLVTVTTMSVAMLPQRIGASLVAVVGIAGVVAVLVTVLSISEGFRAALALSGRDDVAIVLRGGSTDELASGVTLQAAKFVMDSPHIVQDAAGPQASPELYVVVDVAMRTTGTKANVPLRGVGPNAFAIRRAFHLVEGRNFRRGLNEIVVGRGAASQFRGLKVGNVIRFGSTPWTVVGIFSDGGSVSESEIWTDATVLQGVYHRGTTFQSVRVRLPYPAAIESLRSEFAADPRFNLTVRSEREFYEQQSRALTGLVTTVGTLIAALMGIGAVFAALNTMYSAVAARTREIATLRALGFGAAPVVASVLVESLVLGLLGGILGGIVAYAGFNGFQASTMNWNSFSQLAFAFTVTPRLLLSGVLYALLLGFLGGLLPGIRAARLPVTEGLREL